MNDDKKCTCQQKQEDLKKERDSLLERLLDVRRQLREEQQKNALMIRSTEELNQIVDAIFARLAELYGSVDSTPGSGIIKGYSLLLSGFDLDRLMAKYEVHAVRGDRAGDYRITVMDRKYMSTEDEGKENA